MDLPRPMFYVIAPILFACWVLLLIGIIKVSTTDAGVAIAIIVLYGIASVALFLLFQRWYKQKYGAVEAEPGA